MLVYIRPKANLDEWRKKYLSRFFHQEPLGGATGFHESLPSFLQRLAMRHSVPNGPFFLREIHPRPVPSTGSLLGKHSRSLLVGNGYAEQVAQKVAQECCEDGVIRMIQATLSQHIALFKDLRSNAAWCPECLSEWIKEEKEIYRPLLWSFNSVKICPRHKAILQDRCPHCSEAFYHFSPTSWSVDCSACGKSLLEGNPEYAHSKQEEFAANAVGELLKWGWTCCEADFTAGQFKLNIERAITAVGGEYRLSSLSGLTRAVIHAWKSEERRPSLQGLVSLSYCFNVPIHSWLVESDVTKHFSSDKTRKVPATQINRRHPPIEDVRRAITAYLENPTITPCSLSKMARDINTSTYRLYRDCPDLAARVVKRHAEYQSAQKSHKLETRKEAVRKAIHDVAKAQTSISRNAVLKLLKKRGHKSVWSLKQIFSEEIRRSTLEALERLALN